MQRLRRRVEDEFGLVRGALAFDTGTSFYARGRGNAVFAADSFALAVDYAERGGSEALMFLVMDAQVMTLALDKNDWTARNRAWHNYIEKHQLSPIVLAIDVPFGRIDGFADRPDPESEWRRWHPPEGFVASWVQIEPPVPIDWVVAAVDPNEILVQ